MLRGRFLSYCDSFKGRLRSWVSDRSPPCVCGRDVIEVTHGLAAAANRGWLGLRESGGQLPGSAAGGGDRTAQGRFGPAAADRSGDAHHSERAWSVLVRLSQNGHVKVRDIAQAMINAHCRRLSPADIEIPSAIEMHRPDGVRLICARVDGQQPTSESSQ
jgi:hypothetical protein